MSLLGRLIEGVKSSSVEQNGSIAKNAHANERITEKYFGGSNVSALNQNANNPFLRAWSLLHSANPSLDAGYFVLLDPFNRLLAIRNASGRPVTLSRIVKDWSSLDSFFESFPVAEPMGISPSDSTEDAKALRAKRVADRENAEVKTREDVAAQLLALKARAEVLGIDVLELSFAESTDTEPAAK